MPVPAIMKLRGVYAWRNKVNGKVYVGGAYISFEDRWKSHLSSLRRGMSRCVRLQAAWNKYGEEAFEFLILDVVYGDKKSIEDRETYWIAERRAVEDGYNICHNAQSRLGAKLSDESKVNVSNSLKEQWDSGRRVAPPPERNIMSEKCKARKKLAQTASGFKTKRHFAALEQNRLGKGLKTYKGSQCGRSKMTELQVMEDRRAYNYPPLGEKAPSIKSLASKRGLSKNAMGGIIHCISYTDCIPYQLEYNLSPLLDKWKVPFEQWGPPNTDW